MKYFVRGENLEVTNNIKNYVIEKLSKVDKYLEKPEVTEARILLKTRLNSKKIEVTIIVNSYFLRAEEEHEDMYAAIDLVTDKIERQFKKYREKLISRHKKNNFNDLIENIKEDNEEIVKVKNIFLKPMDKKEAIIQMELLSHTFFVFKDRETKKICVLYKRKDGNYGLLETE